MEVLSSLASFASPPSQIFFKNKNKEKLNKRVRHSLCWPGRLQGIRNRRNAMKRTVVASVTNLKKWPKQMEENFLVRNTWLTDTNNLNENHYAVCTTEGEREREREREKEREGWGGWIVKTSTVLTQRPQKWWRYSTKQQTTQTRQLLFMEIEPALAFSNEITTLPAAQPGTMKYHLLHLP